MEKNYLHPGLVRAAALECQAGRSRIGTAEDVPLLRTDHPSAQEMLPGMRQVAQTGLKALRPLRYKSKPQPTDHPLKLERELLLALNHGAVGRSCFPGPRVIDPSVAADYGPRPMRASEFGVIGKRVM